MSQKPSKLKSAMNNTGPLPKHMLSPATFSNNFKGKSKHSRYFDEPEAQDPKVIQLDNS